jgi:hypothetical protein
LKSLQSHPKGWLFSLKPVQTFRMQQIETFGMTFFPAKVSQTLKDAVKLGNMPHGIPNDLSIASVSSASASAGATTLGPKAPRPS